MQFLKSGLPHFFSIADGIFQLAEHFRIQTCENLRGRCCADGQNDAAWLLVMNNDKICCCGNERKAAQRMKEHYQDAAAKQQSAHSARRARCRSRLCRDNFADLKLFVSHDQKLIGDLHARLVEEIHRPSSAPEFPEQLPLP
uniref:hypothetical protein n=1 Tax=Candidatus Electronema sp. TaxID=2698783 RepID=UPI0040573F0D